MCFIGIPTVKEAEAICLLEALLWVQSLHMSNVIFETDAKSSIDAIFSTKSDVSEFGSLISSYKAIVDQEQTFQVCHVKRQANNTAHLVDKATCYLASPSV